MFSSPSTYDAQAMGLEVVDASLEVLPAPTPKYPIQLVAFDLDGTLLRHDLTFPEGVQEAVKRLIQQEHLTVAIATGRMLYSAMPFAQALGLKGPLITYQGGMVLYPEDAPAAWQRPNVDTDPILLPSYHQPVPRETALTLVKDLTEMGYSINCYLHPQLLIQAVDEEDARWYERTSGVTPLRTQTLLEHMEASPLSPTKLAIMAREPEKAKALKAYLADAESKHPIVACQSRSFFFEVNHVHATKWHAIEAVCHRLQIPTSHTLCIGDHGNDIPMLRQAGYGIAMGNATAEAKAAATWVTKAQDEGGIIHALTSLGLLPS
ncbi:MAG: Cof-type HAD-IIB family hydrolase [Vampirovibrionales bacterium]